MMVGEDTGGAQGEPRDGGVDGVHGEVESGWMAGRVQRVAP